MVDISLLKVRLRKLAVSITHPVCWYPLSRGVAASVEHLALLRSLAVDCILDVGANRGQFSLACRIAKPGIPVYAFEPIEFEANTFEQVHSSSGNVTLIRHALGDQPGVFPLHVSNHADSSSLLPIGEKQVHLFPQTQEIKRIDVQVDRLDDHRELWGRFSRILLKIDVQGFELNVLKGGPQALNQCQFIYVECSDVELYEGQSLRSEIVEFLSTHGFRQSKQLNATFAAGALIQADYLFERV